MGKVWKALYSENNKPTKADVGLSNVADENRATILGGTFTGDIGGTSAASIKTQSEAGQAAKNSLDGFATGNFVVGSSFLCKLNSVTAASETNLDMNTSTNFKISLDRAVTLTVSNLSLHEGQTGIIVLVQDGTGGRTVALASEMKTPRGDSISFETGADTTSILSYFIVSTSIIAVNYMGNFS